jgi:hypothetical protein
VSEPEWSGSDARSSVEPPREEGERIRWANQADPGDVTAVILAVAFVVVACLGVALPAGWYVLEGRRATKALGGWKEWLTRHNGWVTAASTALGGIFLVARGVTAFAG